MNLPTGLERVVENVDQSENPTVIFGIGIPGSGKSTALSRLGSIYQTKPIEVDDLRRRMMKSGWYPGLVSDLEGRVQREASVHIANGGIALLDSTYCEAENRRQDMDLYRSIGVRSIGGIWIDTPLELAIERDASRAHKSRVGRQTIEAMSRSLNTQLPSVAEGFDWVVRITPGE